MPEQDLEELAEQVREARLAKGWSKERAAREAEVSSITYKRVEDGLNVQDAKRAAILLALDLPLTAGADAQVAVTTEASGTVTRDRDDGPEFEFLTRVRQDLTTEQMEQLMKEATPYLEMLMRDIKNRKREQD